MRKSVPGQGQRYFYVSVMVGSSASIKQNEIYDRISGVEKQLEERITQAETKFDKRMTNLEEKYDNLDKKVTELDEKVQKLDEKVTSMDKKVSILEITVDNEINKSISIIAEGHLSLNEKLDRSLQVMQKQEMMGLQMTRLESNIQKIKMQLGYS